MCACLIVLTKWTMVCCDDIKMRLEKNTDSVKMTPFSICVMYIQLLSSYIKLIIFSQCLTTIKTMKLLYTLSTEFQYFSLIIAE